MNKKEINSILVINLGGIGDFLLSTPAIRALKKAYPHSNLYLLASPRIAQFAKSLNYIDKVFVFYISYGGVISFSGIFKNINILLSLRRQCLDLAINTRTLHSDKGAKKIKFILDVINPKIKAGRDTEGRGYFYDIKISEPQIGKKYEMEYDIDTVKALGAKIVEKRIDFGIKDEAIKRVNGILKKEGAENRDILIGIHPGGMPSRRWPIENFSKVIEEISKSKPSKFVITAGENEIGLVRKLTKITNVKLINLAGRLNIEELGALIKRCNLFITNDTGPMHIAAILKVPLIAIFGPGDIIRFDPRNISDRAVVLHRKVDCAPCEKVKCLDLKCLKVISPEEVTAFVTNLFESKM